MESALERGEKSLSDRIRERLIALYKASSDLDTTSRHIAEHAAHLRERYPDAYHWRAYWVLVGGTPEFPDDQLREDDFPGEDSVGRFLDGLLEGISLVDQIRALKRKVYGKESGVTREERIERVRQVTVFAGTLKEKYPDFQRWRVYHALIGSTPGTSNLIEGDFPGEDSVVNFLESLITT